MCLRNGISASISILSCDDDLSDMEREQYRKQIRELIGAVETLLDANRSIGEQLSEANSAIGALQDYVNTLENKIKKLEGKNASNNRIRYAKPGEKMAKAAQAESDKGKTKEQAENDYIENEGKVDDAHTDDDDEKEAGSVVSSRSS